MSAPGAWLRGAATGAAVRRTRRDAPVLVAALLVAALATAGPAGAPGAVDAVLDTGAAEAVAAAGARADLVLRVDLVPPGSGAPEAGVADVLAVADALPAEAPPALAAAAGTPVVTVSAGAVRAEVTGAAAGAPSRVAVTVGLLTDALADALPLRAGTLPGDPRNGAVPVVVTTAAAAEGLAIGTRLTTRPASPGSAPGVLEVVGVVERPPSGSRDDLPGLADARGGGIVPDLTVLTSATGIEAVAAGRLDPADGVVRVPLDPSGIDRAGLARILDELEALAVASAALQPRSGVPVAVRSDLERAVAPFEREAAGAAGLLAALAAAIGAAVLAVLVLLGGLLAGRRHGDLLLERTRGRAGASILLGAAAEAVLVLGAGAVLGSVLLLAVTGRLPDPLLVAGLLVVGAAALVVRPSPGRLAGGRAAGVRVACEAGLVLLAAAAAVAAVGRGLRETASGGVDPLLAAAPVLLAVVAVLAVVRLLPVVARSAAAGAARTRGVVGPLAAAHLRRSAAVLPVLAVGVAVAVAVSSCVVAASTGAAQLAAAQRAVGADARLDGTGAGDALAAVTGAPGVTAAAAVVLVGDARVSSGGAGAATASVVGAGTGLADALAGSRTADDRALLDRLAAAAADGPLEAVLGPSLAERVTGSALRIRLDGRDVDATVVGVLAEDPPGLGDDVLLLGAAALAARVDGAPVARALLVAGPGASDAVRALASDDARPTTPADRLATIRSAGLTSGVATALDAALVAGAVLAILALVATALAGVAHRRRDGALLRALGAEGGALRVLAAAELVPVALGGAVAGAAAGVASAALVLRATADAAPLVVPAAVWAVLVVAGTLATAAAVAMGTPSVRRIDATPFRGGEP